jgi:hypothetical protein
VDDHVAVIMKKSTELKVVEISEKEFLEFFNACPIPFPSQAIKEMMVSILKEPATLVIHHK